MRYANEASTIIEQRVGEKPDSGHRLPGGLPISPWGPCSDLLSPPSSNFVSLKLLVSLRLCRSVLPSGPQPLPPHRAPRSARRDPGFAMSMLKAVRGSHHTESRSKPLLAHPSILRSQQPPPYLSFSCSSESQAVATAPSPAPQSTRLF